MRNDFHCHDLSSSYLPVVVHVTELVGEPLHVVRFESARVVHHVVVRWGDAAQANGLAHDEEVVPGGDSRQRVSQ